MARRMTTEEFVVKARSVHGEKFDYSKSVYVNKKTPVKIICPVHGEFETTPSVHFRSDCAKCKLEERSKRKAKTTEEFIREAIAIHGEKYDYSKTEYVNKRTEVVIICKVHGEFKQFPGNHLTSSGCNTCARIDAGQRRRGKKHSRRVTSTEEFIKEAKKVHGDAYSYELALYKGADKSITISCPEHGPFEQRASNHLHGFRCKRCTLSERAKKLSHGTEGFIQRAREVHGNKYSYELVEYKKSTHRVRVICPEHGEFDVYPVHHLRGIACKECAYDDKKNSLEEFIEQSKMIHGDKFDYSRVNYVDNNTKVTIVCPKHGPFEQIPRSHSTSTAAGCRECNQIGFWDLTVLTEAQLNEGNGVYVFLLEEVVTGDQLIKIGITKSLRERCRSIENESKGVYQVKVLAYHPQKLIDAIELEQSLHNDFYDYREKPIAEFSGSTECFSLDILHLLEDLQLVDSEQLERLRSGYELMAIEAL